MKHIFYLITIIPIFWELSCLYNSKKTHQFIGSIKGKKYDDYNPKQKTLVILMIGYLSWTMIGLFTFQWPIFIILFFMGIVNKKYKLHRWFDNLISLIILVFIILNAYHFKIDLWSLFLNCL